MPRQRLRDLGISIGRFPTGPWNAITDVPGVMVGQSTIIEGTDKRTGVTAVLPKSGSIFHSPIVGGHFVLNGAGEVSGLVQLAEWGVLETPILLTNTLSVGAVSHGAVQYMVEQSPGIGTKHDVIIPVVGECDDSFLNDIAGDHVTAEHVYEALRSARSGPVEEGSVGSGTGMITCDLKAGIGTASRVVASLGDGTTIGVLVMSNFGRLRDLRIDGLPIGRRIEPMFAELEKRRTLYGSIICVLGTNAPVSSKQLDRLCKRAALGIGRAGSYAAHGSGEIIVGFSTANAIQRGELPDFHHLRQLPDRKMDALYAATIEATEEAIANALCMAEPMIGTQSRFVPALPLDVLVETWEAWRAVEQRGYEGSAGSRNE
jgi:D-aminopeptidase